MDTKVCFITGCASGIGKRLAVEAYQRGYRVVVSDIDEAALRHLTQELGWQQDRFLSIGMDVCNHAAWQNAIEQTLQRFGRIDVLMNVAGVLKSGYVFEPCPIADIDLQLNVNVKGLMYGTYQAAQQMVKQKSGHIINIASLAGIAPVPGMAVYSASKHAVRGFSLAVAAELRPHNVHVTAVCPDAVDTPMLSRMIEQPQAVLSFSGKPLSVEDVCQLIFGSVMRRRPVEAVIPAGRGFLARLAMFFPGIIINLQKPFVALGKKRQEQLLREKTQTTSPNK